MKVKRSKPDGISLLTLTGEFDSFDTGEMAAELDACIAAGEPRVVLDLGDVVFATSTTIAWFITAQRIASASGGEVALARPRHFLLKSLKTLGLDRVFSVFDTTEAAIAHLKNPAPK